MNDGKPELETHGLTKEAVLAQLDRILASSEFANAPRLSAFLKFAVAKSLAGQPHQLKEYQIGVEVFERPPDYEPSADPSVRVAARQLRLKLSLYYLNSGVDDPIIIELPKGGYVPHFKVRQSASVSAEARSNKETAVGFSQRLWWRPATICLATLSLGLVAWRLVPKKAAPYSVEVRSFAYLGPASQPISKGLRDELSRGLSRHGGLRVTQSQIAARENGRRSTADAVVRGDVGRIGDKLRLRVEIVRAAGGQVLWSNTYESAVNDWREGVSEITEDVVNAIGADIAGRRSGPGGTRGAVESGAYLFYLRGRMLWNQRTTESIRKAILSFEQALEVDPQSALAYAGLADCYTAMLDGNLAAPNHVAPKAKRAVARALEIDPELPEAHTALGSISTYYDWRWEEGERHHRRAINAKPDYAAARQGLATNLLARGRFEESIRQARLAQQLDPLSFAIDRSLAVCYLYARRYEEGIQECNRILAVRNSPWMYGLLAVLQGMKHGRDAFVEGRRREIRERTINGESDPVLLVEMEWLEGRKEEFRRQLDQLIELSRTQYVSAVNIARLWGLLGEVDRSFEWLEQAYQQRDGGLIWLNVCPGYDSIRSDPRFQDLMRRIGLVR